MSVPNYESSIPQGGLNQAHFVGNILREVFGIQSPVYVSNAWLNQPGAMPAGYGMPEVQKAQFPNYEDVRLLPAEESTVKSVFGTPVLGDITFEGGSYNRYNKYTGAIEKGQYGAYTLPYSCLVDFSRSNNVITTPVLGGNGTVKEIYGTGDWDITIRGIAFNNDKYGNNAHQIIKQIIERSDICDAFEVSGSVFYEKNITRIVIKIIDIQPIEAKWNVIPFTIQAVSDEPVELTI
jgi:hypothetical protein